MIQKLTLPDSNFKSLGPTAVLCESQAPLDILEDDGLARPVVDVEDLEWLIGELRGDQDDDDVELAEQPRVCAGDEAHDLPRVVGVRLELD